MIIGYDRIAGERAHIGGVGGELYFLEPIGKCVTHLLSRSLASSGGSCSKVGASVWLATRQEL